MTKPGEHKMAKSKLKIATVGEALPRSLERAISSSNWASRGLQHPGETAVDFYKRSSAGI
jgi:hypothetical protein